MMQFAENLTKDGNYLEGILVLKNILAELSKIKQRSPQCIEAAEDLTLKCNDKIC